MEFHVSIFFIIEVIGTIAFASSGAMVAIKQQLDLLGVVVLGVTTAVGGGMMRDIILGNVPPSLFMNPVYVLTAFITVLVLFIVVRLNQKILESRYIAAYEKMMNIFDAIGLAAFTVTGKMCIRDRTEGRIMELVYIHMVCLQVVQRDLQIFPESLHCGGHGLGSHYHLVPDSLQGNPHLFLAVRITPGRITKVDAPFICLSDQTDSIFI